MAPSLMLVLVLVLSSSCTHTHPCRYSGRTMIFTVFDESGHTPLPQRPRGLPEEQAAFGSNPSGCLSRSRHGDPMGKRQARSQSTLSSSRLVHLRLGRQLPRAALFFAELGVALPAQAGGAEALISIGDSSYRRRSSAAVRTVPGARPRGSYSMRYEVGVDALPSDDVRGRTGVRRVEVVGWYEVLKYLEGTSQVGTK